MVQTQQANQKTPDFPFSSVGLYTLAFVLVNLLTLKLWPLISEDGCFNVALNLARHLGYSSNTDFVRGEGFFAASNHCPLYIVFLSKWISLGGFSMFWCRVLNVLFAAVTVWVSSLFAWKSGLVRSVPFLWMYMVVLGCGYDLLMAYRFDRSEIMNVLIIAIGLYASTIRKAQIRYSALLLLGIADACTSIADLPCLGSLFIVCLLLKNWFDVKNMIVAGFGEILGIAGLIWMYVASGTFEEWFYMFHANGVTAAHTFRERISGVMTAYLADKSVLPMLLVLLLVLVLAGRKISNSMRIGAGGCLLLPAIYAMVGHYPGLYYCYTFYFLTLIFVAIIEVVWPQVALIFRTGILLTTLIVAYYGLLGRTVNSLIQRNQKDYGKVEAFADAMVREKNLYVVSDGIMSYALNAKGTSMVHVCDPARLDSVSCKRGESLILIHRRPLIRKFLDEMNGGGVRWEKIGTLDTLHSPDYVHITWSFKRFYLLPDFDDDSYDLEAWRRVDSPKP